MWKMLHTVYITRLNENTTKKGQASSTPQPSPTIVLTPIEIDFHFRIWKIIRARASVERGRKEREAESFVLLV
jgi:hypothetical protein